MLSNAREVEIHTRTDRINSTRLMISRINGPIVQNVESVDDILECDIQMVLFVLQYSLNIH